MKNIEEIVKQLKKDTNNIDDITYRKKYLLNRKIYIIYNEPLTSSDKISDFIIRSLDSINKENKNINIIDNICNNIDNFKSTTTDNYNKMCYYLNYGFTIILIEKEKEAIVLETKRNLSRSISPPLTENTLRAPMDAFTEDMQTNIGLIRRRIKSNDLWIDSYELGKYTKTKIKLIYIKSIYKKKYINAIKKELNKINIDGILNTGVIKNLITKENNSIFPTTITTERPDKVCSSLLKGKIIILVDNSPFAIIIPACLNDFFLQTEDTYSKSINISLTRIIRYLSFFITLLTPAIYISLTTHNHNLLPLKLLINFSTQRENVPFSAFTEALIMLVSFEILKESELRLPNFTTSSLSIVGALILGQAAVDAGIVSPIMIIIIAITSISSLTITEPELTNGIRWYRLLFMISANFFGINGIIIILLILIMDLIRTNSFGLPYMYPIIPLNISSLKNSIIKFPIKKLNKRDKYLSNNIIKYKEK